MKSQFLKRIHIAVIFGLICAVLLRFSGFVVNCDNLKENVLRLHIRANSDSAEDQAVKLCVRDRILKECSYIFENCTDLQDAVDTVRENMDVITAAANSELKEQGFGYEAQSGLGETYFETRQYDTFTLPAGNYRSLIVELGEAKGENWWCVVFPTVCLPTACDSSLSDTADEESVYIAEHPEQFKVRFKIVEWYEQIRNFFS